MKRCKLEIDQQPRTNDHARRVTPIKHRVTSLNSRVCTRVTRRPLTLDLDIIISSNFFKSKAKNFLRVISYSMDCPRFQLILTLVTALVVASSNACTQAEISSCVYGIKTSASYVPADFSQQLCKVIDDASDCLKRVTVNNCHQTLVYFIKLLTATVETYQEICRNPNAVDIAALIRCDHSRMDSCNAELTKVIGSSIESMCLGVMRAVDCVDDAIQKCNNNILNKIYIAVKELYVPLEDTACDSTSRRCRNTVVNCEVGPVTCKDINEVNSCVKSASPYCTGYMKVFYDETVHYLNKLESDCSTSNGGSISSLCMDNIERCKASRDYTECKHIHEVISCIKPVSSYCKGEDKFYYDDFVDYLNTIESDCSISHQNCLKKVDECKKEIASAPCMYIQEVSLCFFQEDLDCINDHEEQYDHAVRQCGTTEGPTVPPARKVKSDASSRHVKSSALSIMAATLVVFLRHFA